MPERAQANERRDEEAWSQLGQDLHQSFLPLLPVQTPVSAGLVSAEAQSFTQEAGRRLLLPHPILVARGQAAPASRKSGPRGYCARNPTPKVGAIPHPRAAPAVLQRGLLGCPVLLTATALGSGSPECNHTGSAGLENPVGLSFGLDWGHCTGQIATQIEPPSHPHCFVFLLGSGCALPSPSPGTR